MAAYGTGTYGLGTYGIGGVSAAPGAAGDAAFLIQENVGFLVSPSSGDAEQLIQENVGFLVSPSSGDGILLMQENLGVEPIVTTHVISPQIGWGLPMKPQADATLVLASSDPTMSIFENVTT